jgi:TetR/AcrR family transcriptional repressor of nem operon
MDSAGMTVGGFYAHFPSKQALVIEALRSSFRKAGELLQAGLEDKRGSEWIEAVASRYLSRAHRDAPVHGCPLPATAGEIARTDQEVRDALAGEIDYFISGLEPKLIEVGDGPPRGEALATLSLMVGGLTLARALKGTPLSDEVLQACRRHIANRMT